MCRCGGRNLRTTALAACGSGGNIGSTGTLPLPRRTPATKARPGCSRARRATGTTASASFRSGMYYYLYRFYDPYLQRWLNRDPLEEQYDVSLYRPVYNSPLNYIDLDGRWGGGIIVSGTVEGGAIYGGGATGAIGGGVFSGGS